MTEIDTLRQLDELLEGLSPEAVARVVKWAADKYSVQLAGATTTAAAQSDSPQPKIVAADLPDYFNRAQPGTGAEKGLVVAAWLQTVQGMSDFDSGSVNRELKNLGYQSSNITRDFDDLMARRPKLVVQTRKSGSTKQARKLYRVTHEGLAEVAKMRGERS
jgi:hypothetical protein